MPDGSGPSNARDNLNADQIQETEGNSRQPMVATDDEEISVVNPGTTQNVTSAKGSINFPDSPTTPESIKRPRRHLIGVRPDSPSQEASRAGQSSPRHHQPVEIYYDGRHQGTRPVNNHQYGFESNERRFPNFNGQSSSRTTRRHVRTFNANIDESQNDILLSNVPPRIMPRTNNQVREIISIDIPTESPDHFYHLDTHTHPGS